MITFSVRDNKTYRHSWRVAKISTLIAKDMGLCDELIEKVNLASHLHDIGKIGIPDSIIDKPGKLKPCF